MYRVLISFADTQDGHHIYEVGDEYPRLGLMPNEGRIDELSTEKNRCGVPLIELVTPKETEKPKAKTAKTKAKT